MSDSNPKRTLVLDSFRYPVPFAQRSLKELGLGGWKKPEEEIIDRVLREVEALPTRSEKLARLEAAGHQYREHHGRGRGGANLGANFWRIADRYKKATNGL